MEITTKNLIIWKSVPPSIYRGSLFHKIVTTLSHYNITLLWWYFLIKMGNPQPQKIEIIKKCPNLLLKVFTVGTHIRTIKIVIPRPWVNEYNPRPSQIRG